MTVNDASNEITLIRRYDVPVQAVWAAWQDADQAAEWWGPRGFTTKTEHKDLRPGGVWRYTMRGPDGTVYPNVTRYLEVQECSRLVYDHGGSDDRPPLFRVTVNFSEAAGKTEMAMTMAFPTPELARTTRGFIKEVGGDTTWDRLAEFLAKRLTGREIFVINRAFDTSLTEMFELWTVPSHFSQWLPPTGATMKFLEADIRPGGSAFYQMSAPGGIEMFGRVHYQRIERPDFLLYTQQFCTAQGAMARHPLAPTWPETMLTEVRLAEEGPSRTRVTVTWEPYGEVTPEELATFCAARAGMTQGWTGSFDKLERSIEEQRRP